MTAGVAGQHYLLGAANWTFETYLGRIARAADVWPPRIKLPKAVALWGSRIQDEILKKMDRQSDLPHESVDMASHYWYFDSAAAKADLGFLPRDPQETIVDTVVDIRKHVLS